MDYIPTAMKQRFQDTIMMSLTYRGVTSIASLGLVIESAHALSQRARIWLAEHPAEVMERRFQHI
jgi:hypothetical protein